MHRFSGFARLLLAAVIVACHEPPTALRRFQPRSRAIHDIGPTPTTDQSDPTIVSYWRLNNDRLPTDTITIYDKTLQLGFNIHQPGDFHFVSDFGSRLIRYAVYWDGSESQQLAAAINALPSGAVLDIVFHKEHACRSDYGGYDGARHAYVNALSALVSQAAATPGKVAYWELWNEMDATGWTDFFGGVGGPACSVASLSLHDQGVEYAALLREAYPAIKAADANAVVVVGGMINRDSGYWGFLRGIYDGGAAGSFDILNIHTYGNADGPDYPWGDEVRSIASSYGDARRQLWASEFGWSWDAYFAYYGRLPHDFGSYDDSTELEATQQKYWNNYIAGVRSTGQFSKVAGYAIEDAYAGPAATSYWANVIPSSLPIGNFGFGLVRPDRSPKPIYGFVQGLQVNAPPRPMRDYVFDVHSPGQVPAYDRYCVIGPDSLRVVSHVNDLTPTSVPFVVGVTTVPAGTGVAYEAHVSGYGWLSCQSEGGIAGTTGESRQMEALELSLVGTPTGMGVMYRAYGPYGAGGADAWQPWVYNGRTAGTEGMALPLKSIQIQLTNYPNSGWSICYQTHVAVYGWGAVACDGQVAPIEQYGTDIEAVRVWLYGSTRYY